MSNSEINRHIRDHQKVQLMFVLDVTRSMSAEIKGIKESIAELMAFISSYDVTVEVGLTWFRDIQFDQRPGTFDFGGEAFTQDARAFVAQVNDLKAFGGGGNPYESSKHGLFLASKCFTRDDARRFLVLITDQRPYPDGKGKDPSVDLVVRHLKIANVEQLYCVIRERWRQHFQPLCDPLSGKIFPLPEDGRTPEAFRTILADIGVRISTYLQKIE